VSQEKGKKLDKGQEKVLKEKRRNLDLDYKIHQWGFELVKLFGRLLLKD